MLVRWWYMLSSTNSDHFCYVFFRHRAVFPPRDKNSVGNQKSCWYKINLNNVVNIPDSRPLHNLMLAGTKTQTTMADKIDIQIFLTFIWLKFVFKTCRHARCYCLLRKQFRASKWTSVILCGYVCLIFIYWTCHAM